MSELVDNLFQLDLPKQFAKRFKEIEADLGEPTALLGPVTEQLPLRCYEKHYDLNVPHGMFGLSAAATIQPLIPEGQKAWPIIQQVWAIKHEPKRPPYRLDEKRTPTEETTGPLLESFAAAVREEDFDGAYAAAVALCRTPEGRVALRGLSMDLALQDLAQGGLKPLYLAQCWRLAEILNWENTENILFPALHYLVVGPADTRISALVQKSEAVLSRIDQNNGELTESIYQELEQTLLFSRDANAPGETLETLARAGVGSEAAWDALSLSAAQCLINSSSGLWKDPVKALLFVYSLSSQPDAGSSELPHAAWLIHQASALSKEEAVNRNMDDLTVELGEEEIFTTLRSVISYSGTYAAVNAAEGILKLGKADELFQNLATLAAKNDGRIGKGYDLMLVEACEALYGKSKTSLKKKLPVACTFFLGRLLKDYDLLSAYGV